VLLLKELRDKKSRKMRVDICKDALDAIPGKHTKSAQAIEKKKDALRSGAKERQRVRA
jgi:hypothetical protein